MSTISAIRIQNNYYRLVDGSSTIVSDNLVPENNLHQNLVKLYGQPGGHIYKLQIYYWTTLYLYDTTSNIGINRGRIGGSNDNGTLNEAIDTYNNNLVEDSNRQIVLCNPYQNINQISMINYLSIPINICLTTNGEVGFERIFGTTSISTTQLVNISSAISGIAYN